MSEAKRYIPRSPRGQSMEALGADTRHQAIEGLKGLIPTESIHPWDELQKAGWKIIDRDGPTQQELY